MSEQWFSLAHVFHIKTETSIENTGQKKQALRSREVGGRAEGVSGLPKFADNMPVFRRALGGIDD